MSRQGASQTVAAGAVTATVGGAFSLPYPVGISTGWVTGVRITAKTAAGFTVEFAVPPVAQSTFDWVAGSAVSPDSGATQAIAAGLSTATVTGVFGSTYQVAIGPAWVTDYEIISQTATSFVVVFGTPAPPGGSTFDWVAVVPLSSLGAVGAVTPVTSASQAIAAGETQLVVVTTGALPSAYEVTVSTGWVTSFDVISKTTTGFTIVFAVPVPPGGSTVYWVALGPNNGLITLQDYLDELRDLLHDPNDRFWSAAQKTRYINKGRQRRDVDTAVNRSLLSFTLTAGIDTYTFAQVGNGQIIDVLSIFLQFGQTRVLLDNPALSVLNTNYRQSINLTGWTRGWARRGPSTVVFGPNPATAYVTEWDSVVYGNPLIALTDFDPLPYPYTQPVAYYAAYLAKINERESDEKNEFFDAYQELVGMATNQRGPQIPMAYSGLRRG